MRTQQRLMPSITRSVLAGLLALTVLLAPAGAGASISESVTGTLPGYQTTVEREVQGDLSDENLRQTSLLGSQILLHLNAAVHDLEDAKPTAASAQIEKALTLVDVIRDMLPTTVETTIVTDATGAEVYRHTEQSQDDLIPIYQEMTAVEVVKPMLDVRWDHAAVEGVQLADVDVIHTAILADLRYIERRLRRARAAIESPDEALGHLRLAHVRGLHFSVDRTDSPLLDAQRALRLAERMAEDENYEAAEANLRVARDHLTTYRGLVSGDGKGAVKDLQAEIERLEGDLDERSPGLIRGYWQRVTGWLRDSPGEATATQGTAADPTS